MGMTLPRAKRALRARSFGSLAAAHDRRRMPEAVAQGNGGAPRSVVEVGPRGHADARRPARHGWPS
eukprot:4611004-Lingulodinium_polyedra.AAC.1